MSIFNLRQSLIDEYSKYVQSFFSIADERLRGFINEELLTKRALWPDTLLQFIHYDQDLGEQIRRYPDVFGSFS